MTETEKKEPGTGLRVGTLAQLFEAEQPRVFTSLDVTSEYGRAMAMVFMQNGTAGNLVDFLDKALPVQDFIVHGVNFTDDDGVEVAADRIVLISPDGQAYAAVSGGVKRSLGLLIAVYGNPPWKPAKMVKAVAVRTRRKFTTITLVPVIEKPGGTVGAEVKAPPQPSGKK